MPSSRGSPQPRAQNRHLSPTSPALANGFFTRFKFIYTCLNEAKLLSRNKALVHNQKYLMSLRVFLFVFTHYVLSTHTLVLQTWRNSLAQIPSPVWKEIIRLSQGYPLEPISHLAAPRVLHAWPWKSRHPLPGVWDQGRHPGLQRRRRLLRRQSGTWTGWRLFNTLLPSYFNNLTLSTGLKNR